MKTLLKLFNGLLKAAAAGAVLVLPMALSVWLSDSEIVFAAGFAAGVFCLWRYVGAFARFCPRCCDELSILPFPLNNPVRNENLSPIKLLDGLLRGIAGLGVFLAPFLISVWLYDNDIYRAAGFIGGIACVLRWCRISMRLCWRCGDDVSARPFPLNK